MTEEFENRAKPLRRKLNELSNTIVQIRDWGRTASGKPEDRNNVAFFRGMLKSLEVDYNAFRETYSQLEAFQDEGATDIPNAADVSLRKTTKSSYFQACQSAELINMHEAETARAAAVTSMQSLNTTSLAMGSDCRIPKSLPKLQVPKFEGEPTEWPKFRDSFVSLVDNDQLLSPIDKLHYLRGCLVGPAFSVISHLTVSGTNYAIAWKAVKDEFDNQRMLASTYLDKILAAKPGSKANPESLKAFLSKVGDSVTAFKMLDITDPGEFILFHLAIRGLDPNTREQFETAHKDVEFPSVDSLIKFVRSRATTLTLAQGTPTPTPTPTQAAKGTKPPQPKDGQKTSLMAQSKPAKKKNASSGPKANNQSSGSSDKAQGPCIICKDQHHHLLSCTRFHEASVNEKWNLLGGFTGCINCLSTTHSVQSCPSKWTCRFCPERHHSSLHRSASTSSTTPQSSSTDQVLNSITSQDAQVILGSAIVEIMDARGDYQQVRVVVDSGSQDSFMTLKCLNKLGLTMQHLRKRISGIGQTPFEGTKGKTTCVIRPRKKHSIQLKTEVIVVSNITSFLPAKTLPLDFVHRCSGFDLADPGFWKPAAIDFLIGADLFSQIMTGSVVPIEGSQASLFSSIFGYIVLGKITGSPNDEESSSLFVMDSDEELNHQLQRFWEIEEPKPTRTFRNPEHEQCEEHFSRTHARLPDGRYMVRLPFKEETSPKVGNSSHIAFKRFLNLERKLEANPKLKKLYHDTISEYLELDHMTPASRPTRFVIPHHSIAKQEGDDIKIRVVFDASVPVPDGPLNAHLLVGEKLQRDIRDVLSSFRRHRFVFSADIVKMFRMINIDPQGRGFLQIYWRFSQQDTVHLFELKTLPFGLSCSPFLALRVIKQLCLDQSPDYPLARRVLEDDIYVDDILTGASSEAETLALKEQLISLLKQGGFELSKWVSNAPSIIAFIENSSVKRVLSLSDKEDSWVKLLGLQWDPEEDAFLFAFQAPTPVYTKRGILSTVARLYDPLGFLTPVTLMMKAIVQDLWKLNLQWDEDIPDQTRSLWDTILGELNLLSKQRIPRFLNTVGCFESHVVGFSDASMKGYAAVLYLRVYTANNGWQVSLLTAKSKLAPTKATSIPRLELSGALLLAQLYTANLKFLASLPSPALPPTFHTDSSIVLGWLNTPSYKLQTFVANRIVRIQELTVVGSWRHVDSEQNPADAASRGLFPSQLIAEELWWKGPEWLTDPQDQWPTPSFAIEKELPDVKPPVVTLVAVHKENPIISWMTRFSSYLKMLRSIAWMRRWLHNVKHVGHRRTGPLKWLELELARTECMKWVQQHHFFQGRPFAHVESRFPDLQPFLDPDGLVRVGGRLRKSVLRETQKFPVLLPTDSHLTNLLVDHYHRAYLHPGPNLLQAIIQQRFWIPSLRRVIRRRGFKCMTCYRSKAKAAVPLMGDLPTYRVNGGRPFLHVGVDFAGPFRLKESSRRNAAVGKVYLCLYVCMATKALHLEAVTRLSTVAFIASLERFTSRRGLPSDIYSDRGSNFLGASNYLKELYEWFRARETKEELLNYATRNSIHWHFNPPLTPHMGGIWEAGVKSVKSHLYKVVGEAVLTYEEMSTVFYKIEAILNSRPLCPLSSSPEETDYLSPGHFLVGGPLVSVPQPSFLDTKENLLDRWQYVNLLSQRFWKRWRAEYLSSLQRRPKWTKRTENLRVGDMVLLKEESPPLSWPLAKVLEVHPGDDGIVRVVKIKTPHATYDRPVAKLIPLLPVSEPPYPEL